MSKYNKIYEISGKVSNIDKNDVLTTLFNPFIYDCLIWILLYEGLWIFNNAIILHNFFNIKNQQRTREALDRFHNSSSSVEVGR